MPCNIKLAGMDYMIMNALSREHLLDVEYVMGMIAENLGKIHNMRKYMIASLFNAPTTMDNYFTQLVHHDMHTEEWCEIADRAIDKEPCHICRKKFDKEFPDILLRYYLMQAGYEVIIDEEELMWWYCIRTVRIKRISWIPLDLQRCRSFFGRKRQSLHRSRSRQRSLSMSSATGSMTMMRISLTFPMWR